MLGRVSSLDWLISIGLLPVSFALTAPVAAALGVRATLVGAGLVGRRSRSRRSSCRGCATRGPRRPRRPAAGAETRRHHGELAAQDYRNHGGYTIARPGL